MSPRNTCQIEPLPFSNPLPRGQDTTRQLSGRDQGLLTFGGVAADSSTLISCGKGEAGDPGPGVEEQRAVHIHPGCNRRSEQPASRGLQPGAGCR
jgi:hypothetical protein